MTILQNFEFEKEKRNQNNQSPGLGMVGQTKTILKPTKKFLFVSV